VRHEAAQVPSCTTLVSELRRARTVPRVAATARELRNHYGVDPGPAAQGYAAVIRVRLAARRAIGDGRPTAARRLFASARLVELRADALSADLCP
jgi:hypothetical protein